MTKIAQSVSIVMPAYNEEANIEFMLAESVKTLEELTDKWDILVIDDCSHDRTFELAQAFAANYSLERIKVVRNPRNIGCHPSELQGLMMVNGEYRFFLCSDRQILPQEVYKFLPALEAGADLVSSWRKHRADPLYRRLISKCYNIVERLAMRANIHDSHSVIMVRDKLIDKVGPEMISDSSFIPLEMIIRSRSYDFKVAEVVIEHHPRLYGTATGINVKDVLRTPLDLIRFWRTLGTIKQQVVSQKERMAE